MTAPASPQRRHSSRGGRTPKSASSSAKKDRFQLLVESGPTAEEVLRIFPESVKAKNTMVSLYYALESLVLSAACVAFGYFVLDGRMAQLKAWLLLPLLASQQGNAVGMAVGWVLQNVAPLLEALNLHAVHPVLAFAVWCAYAVATGTCFTGMWVIAHECGHDAFSNFKALQTAVGYVYHTVLLVPYFSWQRSHAVHHSRTNHVFEGETHVPTILKDDQTPRDPKLQFVLAADVVDEPHSALEDAFAVWRVAIHLLIGWPAYILWGASGGPVRGKTNHFWPIFPFSDKLYDTPYHKTRVFASDVGIASFLALLAWWARVDSLATVLHVYGMPYMVTNMYLVMYTWMHHTNVDIPHLSTETGWTWIKGAFLTVDRPYPWIVDRIHHHIGSTHVAHHINHRIPHYHAREATALVKKHFPQFYNFDSTNVFKAAWIIGRDCFQVQLQKDDPSKGYRFVHARPK